MKNDTNEYITDHLLKILPEINAPTVYPIRIEIMKVWILIYLHFTVFWSKNTIYIFYNNLSIVWNYAEDGIICNLSGLIWLKYGYKNGT